MEQRRVVEGQGYTLNLYLGEIPVRGIGMLTVQECRPGRWTGAFTHGVALLREAGAQVILASSRVEGCPLRDRKARVGPLPFVYRHTLDLLTLDLDEGDGWQPCSLPREVLSRHNAEEFIRLYNDAMDRVPNITTYTLEDLPELMGLRQLAQLYRLSDGTPVAVSELRLGIDRPLLETLGVAEPWRGKGVGGMVLRGLLHDLQQMGYRGAALMVSNANPSAYRFYLAHGFKKNQSYSSWYELQEG